MSDVYHIAVIGAGPGGLSAAAHAASLGVSHILLEKSPKVADTIQSYQKGKHVMAEPGILPLRSDVPFEQGTRENILEGWANSVTDLDVNISFDSEVQGISGEAGQFTLTLRGGETILCEHIVLGIGVQGNLRRLEIPGESAALVQYGLDDPDEVEDEDIMVIGAGDAAIENAVALSGHNRVTIVNRKDEFARAKEGNIQLIVGAIESGALACEYSASPVSMTTNDDNQSGEIVLACPDGDKPFTVNRVIARLGAIPQRALVESFGVDFPSSAPDALPTLSGTYESSVPGLYIIGALAGYPLIKQAMNQGFEVVETILGNDVLPADHELIAAKVAAITGERSVDDTLSAIQQAIPIFTEVNPLLFRELMLDSEIHTPSAGDVIFKKDDYSNSFYSVFAGEVQIEISTELTVSAFAGQFFGELSLLSGRRRSATVRAGPDCVVIETPRRTMNKLLSSVASAKRVLDETFILRTIQSRFAPSASIEDLLPIAQHAELHEFRPGEALFLEGDEADSLHLVRSGSVAVLKTHNGEEVPLAYVAAGQHVGEMGLLGGHTRTATIRAAVRAQTVSVDADSFKQLLKISPTLEQSLTAEMSERLRQNIKIEAQSEASTTLGFLLSQGLGEATDVLLIDKALCVNCDNCEVACAATHDGTSRLDRQAGSVFAEIHVPTSCRHCEDPHCMKDCPPDAIKRSPGGEVYIGDNCIGCGNCEANCPYDVIQMAVPPETKRGFWTELLLGPGAPAKSSAKAASTKPAIKKAVKCDMCKDLAGGPACVRACPTGAADRVSPQTFVELVMARSE